MLSPSSCAWVNSDSICGCPAVFCRRMDMAMALQDPVGLSTCLPCGFSMVCNDVTRLLDDAAGNESETELTAELFAGVYEV